MNSWPPASSGLQTYRQKLTASGNFTVPSGVTLIGSVRCKGGGGGGGGAGVSAANGTNGGTTTFSTVSAAGGNLGRGMVTTAAGGTDGTSAKANTGQAGSGAGCVNVPSSIYGAGTSGSDGAESVDFLAVTPGDVIAYTIGAGGTGGTGSGVGGDGGSGYVELEWQA